MSPQHSDQGRLPPGKRDIPPAKFKIVARAFLELFELLEEYAPVWYTEKHHNRAVVAKRILESFCSRW